MHLDGCRSTLAPGLCLARYLYILADLLLSSISRPPARPQCDQVRPVALSLLVQAGSCGHVGALLGQVLVHPG